MISKYKMVSLLTCIIVFSLLVNPVSGILDVPHQSCLFAVSFLSGFIGLFSLSLNNPSYLRLTIIDLFFMAIVVKEIYFYLPNSSLFALGCFSLSIIYWSVRQTGGLSSAILYGLAIVSILILSIIGYLQYFQILPSNHPSFNITGPYTNPSVYACVLCLLISLPIIWLSHFKNNHAQWHYCFITIIVCIIALPLLWLTHCRAAWMAFLIIVCYAIYHRLLLFGKMRIFIKMFFRHFMVGTCALLFFAALLAYSLYQFKPLSVEGRILIWKVTSQMIKEKPIWGFGPDGFTANYMHFQANYLKTKGTVRERHLADNNHFVYNEPLRAMVEYGVVGLLFYVWIVYLVISHKGKDIHSLSTKFVLVAALVWGLFSYPDQSFPILVIMVIALAEMSNQRSGIYILKCFPYSHRFLKAGIFVAVFWQGFTLVKMYQCHRLLYRTVHCTTPVCSEKVIRELSLLEGDMKNEKLFWICYCSILSRHQKDYVLLEKIANWEQLYPGTDTYVIKGDVYQRLGEPDKAEEAYWEAHYMAPSKQKPRARLAILYQKQGRTSEALAIAREVLTEKVKIYGFGTYEIHRELQELFENQLK